MQRIIDKLATVGKDDNDDDDDVLANTIALVKAIQRRPDGPYPVSWDELESSFAALRDRGLWQSTAENDELVDALRVLLTSSPPVSVAVPQTVQLVRDRVLPVELAGALDNAYALHVLATDPSRILPPAKSLLSVMSRTHVAAPKSTLHARVEDVVHKAFWDEAVDTLSNPEPSVQLSRIKLLYEDLRPALEPLLPPRHPVLVTLSSPLSPTSAPLDSALLHLREVLASLGERCAPARDSEIESLQRQLADPPVAPATLVAETVKSVLRLSDAMKDDLSQFFLGSMTEQQLASVVARQATTTERETVLDVWHQERVRDGWASWLDAFQPPAHLSSISPAPFTWIVRVVQALGSSLPVSCPLPDHASSLNTLPPVFFFSAPTLLEIQNYLQALVIAASLRILTHLGADPDAFMSRVWTLLRAEIAGEPDAGDTKLVNLADEVIRARTRATKTDGELSEEEQETLRAAVNRTLRPEDPVFRLLQRRLLTALVDVLVKRRHGGHGGPTAPAVLRSGRDAMAERAGKRPRLVLDDAEDVRKGPPPTAVDVKGFEDPVLNQAAVEVFERIQGCLDWVERVWTDVVETGDVFDY